MSLMPWIVASQTVPILAIAPIIIVALGSMGIVGLLPKRVNRVRIVLVDVASLAFCAYFAWKSVTLLHEAIVENYHSTSTWAPPLWIPYSLMTAGMILLSVQLLLQVIAGLRGWSSVE